MITLLSHNKLNRITHRLAPQVFQHNVIHRTITSFMLYREYYIKNKTILSMPVTFTITKRFMKKVVETGTKAVATEAAAETNKGQEHVAKQSGPKNVPNISPAENVPPTKLVSKPYSSNNDAPNYHKEKDSPVSQTKINQSTTDYTITGQIGKAGSFSSLQSPPVINKVTPPNNNNNSKPNEPVNNTNPKSSPYGLGHTIKEIKTNTPGPLLITNGREDPTYADLKTAHDMKNQEAKNYDASIKPNTPALFLITDGRENSTHITQKLANETGNNLPDGSVMAENANGEPYRIPPPPPLPQCKKTETPTPEKEPKDIPNKTIIRVTPSPNSTAFLQKASKPEGITDTSTDSDPNVYLEKPTSYVNKKGEVKENVNKKNTSHPLVNKDGKSFNTDITHDTNVNSITNAQAISEMKKRVFAKEDDKTQSKMITESGETITVGEQLNNAKLTPHGQAYNKLVSPSVSDPNNVVPENLSVSTLNIISINSPLNGRCLIKTGIQNHAHTVVREGNYYYSPGYLTGMKGAKLLHDLRYDEYQQQKEGNIPDNKTNQTNAKPQRVAEFDNLLRISTADATVMKYGAEYFTDTETVDYFDRRIAFLKEKPFIDYNPNGVTKETVLAMAKEHDRRVTQDIAHPETKEQLEKKALNSNPLTKNQPKTHNHTSKEDESNN